MSRQTQVIPFDSKGLTANKVDDFSIRIFYRGNNRSGLKNALSALAMRAFGEYKLESEQPGELIYMMTFSCAGDTYNAMSTLSDVRKLL